MAKVGLNLGLNRCLQTTKNHKIKKVATFVATSFRERKTGLKPATPSLEGSLIILFNYLIVSLLITSIKVNRTTIDQHW